MSGSRKKTLISGMTTAASEKHDKRLANPRLRRAVKQTLHAVEGPEILPYRREPNTPWTMAKDGKHWFDARRFPEELRK